jgi:hypothetical protein
MGSSCYPFLNYEAHHRSDRRLRYFLIEKPQACPTALGSCFSTI